MPSFIRALLAVFFAVAVWVGVDVAERSLRQTPVRPPSSLGEFNFPTAQPTTSSTPETAPRLQTQTKPTKKILRPPVNQIPKPSLPPLAAAPIQPPSPLLPPLTDQEFYSRFSKSAIQVLCDDGSQVFSASGVVLNSNGLVLTNAHVAEIVERVGANRCQSRSGNPADLLGGVSVVFIPDTSLKIADTEVFQRDFAFLKITNPRAPFSAASVDASYRAASGESLFTLGYPSEFLQAITASANSNLVFSKLSSAGMIDVDGDLQTAEGYLFNGGLVLQQGSSGTALFSGQGKVVALMFATTKAPTTADRQGVALAMFYIDRILKLETGQGLEGFISSH